MDVRFKMLKSDEDALEKQRNQKNELLQKENQDLEMQLSKQKVVIESFEQEKRQLTE